jgi:pantothenate synthetase
MKNFLLLLLFCSGFAKAQIKQGETKIDLNILAQTCIEMMMNGGFESVDYFSFVNKNFEPIESISKGSNHIYILTAANIEGVRLIDNIIA